jgi:hypothetical protein
MSFELGVNDEEVHFTLVPVRMRRVVKFSEYPSGHCKGRCQGKIHDFTALTFLQSESFFQHVEKDSI